MKIEAIAEILQRNLRIERKQRGGGASGAQAVTDCSVTGFEAAATEIASALAASVPEDVRRLVERLDGAHAQWLASGYPEGSGLLFSEASAALTALSARMADLELSLSELEGVRQENGRLSDRAHERTLRAEQAERDLAAAREKVVALSELIVHAWVHTNYPNCGYEQMTTEEKVLYDATIKAATDEDDEALAAEKRAAVPVDAEREKLAKRLIDRLVLLQIGTCSCGTKMPGLQYHDEHCNYRMAYEAHDLFITLLRTPAEAPDDAMVEYLVNQVCRDVAELPDRTSPEDQPDMMLVSHEELSNVLRAALLAARQGEKK